LRNMPKGLPATQGLCKQGLHVPIEYGSVIRNFPNRSEWKPKGHLCAPIAILYANAASGNGFRVSDNIW